nr:putative receptor-like protein kinase At5g39000 [Tanacetum cinerariifolium]
MGLVMCTKATQNDMSSNILLDDNWKAKISDFRLSKLALKGVLISLIYTEPCGTPGYVDPVYYRGKLTQKYDVYSFGVILFEVLFGKVVYIPKDGKHNSFAEVAQNHYEKNTLDELIDSDLRNQMKPNSLTTFLSIAYQCLKIDRSDRPKMRLVVEELKKALVYQQEASRRFSHDVYISFRDQDTVEYVDSLLNDQGIISSLKFAANSWNLDEIAKIIECTKETKKVVIPIFINECPTDVGRQKGYFGKSMSKYDTHLNMGAWRDALVKATTLPSLEDNGGYRGINNLAKAAAARIKVRSSKRKVKLHGKFQDHVMTNLSQNDELSREESIKEIDKENNMDKDYCDWEDGSEFMVFDEELITKGSIKWKFIVDANGGCYFKFKNEEDMEKAKMKNIPLEAWTKEGIRALASSLRKPLRMDNNTAQACVAKRRRADFARVLVEFEVKKGFKEQIDIQYKNKENVVKGSKKVDVDYQWKPNICSHCMVFGHNEKVGKKFDSVNVEKGNNVGNKDEIRGKNIVDVGFVEVNNRKGENSKGNNNYVRNQQRQGQKQYENKGGTTYRTYRKKDVGKKDQNDNQNKNVEEDNTTQDINNGRSLV